MRGFFSGRPRVLTGVFLAGVYPPGMKLVATWYREGRGFALGVVVGALTLGKASPYLVNALGSSNWRVNVGMASVIAVAGGCLIGFVQGIFVAVVGVPSFV